MRLTDFLNDYKWEKCLVIETKTLVHSFECLEELFKYGEYLYSMIERVKQYENRVVIELA